MTAITKPGREHGVRPFCVSITGADDEVSPADLVALSRIYPFVEWGILHLPAKEGKPRYPTAEWRWNLARARMQHGFTTALHLCSEDVFWTLLQHLEGPGFLDELAQFNRVQLNINARSLVFKTADVVSIYEALRWHDVPLILQRHPGTQKAIDRFLTELAKNPTDSHALVPVSTKAIETGDVSVLLDMSGGKGVSPEEWEPPLSLCCLPVDTGYAGGISPDNIEQVLDATEKAVRGGEKPLARYWIDMESGVRTDNKFDLTKVERVLQAVASRY